MLWMSHGERTIILLNKSFLIYILNDTSPELVLGAPKKASA